MWSPSGPQVSVPYFRWAKLESLAAKKQYLFQLLQVRPVSFCSARSVSFCSARHALKSGLRAGTGASLLTYGCSHAGTLCLAAKQRLDHTLIPACCS